MNAKTINVVKSVQQSRDEREAHQRYVARKRYKSLRKAIPKSDREKYVKKERDAKFSLSSPIDLGLDTYTDSVPTDIKEQGFVNSAALVSCGVLAGAAVISIARLRRDVTAAVRRVDSTMDRADRAIGNTAAQVIHSTNSIGDRVTAAIEGFANSAKSLVGAFWVVPTAILAHYIVGQFTDIPLLPLLAGFFLAKLFGGEIWPHLQKWFVYRPQSGDDYCSFGGLIVAAVCAVCVPFKSIAGFSGEIMKRMSNYQRSKEGFESFFKDGLKYAEKAVNVILGLVSEDQVAWIDTSERLVDAFLDKVIYYERLLAVPTSNDLLPTVLEASQLQLDGLGLKMTVRDQRMLARIDKGLSRLSILMTPYQGAVTATRNFRPEPTFICLYAGSGQGKTTLTTMMASAILLKAGLCKPEDALKNLWQKGTTEYWNGYVNQKCLVMDDCFQLKPVKGETDSEYMNIIRMVGNWAFALNFADVDSKGKFYFDTPLIIGTTNCADVYAMADSVLTEPAAVVRRIRYPYRVEVSKDYLTEDGMLDYARVADEFSRGLDAYSALEDKSNASPMDCYPWEAWQLVRHDFANPQHGGAIRTVRSLIDEVSKVITDKRVSHERSVANHARFMNILGGVVPQSGSQQSNDSWATACESDDELCDNAEPITPNLRNLIFGESDVEQYVPPEPQERRGFQFRDHLRVQRMLLGDAMPTVNRLVFGYSSMRLFAKAVMDKITSVTAGLRQFLSGLTLKGMCKFALGALCLTAVIGLGVGVVAAVKYLYRAISNSSESVEQSNIKETPRAARKPVFKAKSVSAQSNAPADVVHRTIYGNSYKMVLFSGAEPTVVGQVQFVEMRVAMMPAHYVWQLKERLEKGLCTEECKIRFFSTCDKQTVELTVSQFLGCAVVKIADSDLLFMDFPEGSITAAKKIVKHFLTEKQMNDAITANPPVRLDVATYDPECTRHKEGRISQQTFVAQGFTFMASLATQTYENTNVLEYKMPTEVGHCGAPLMIAENRYYGGSCYLGMHVAGAPGWNVRIGYSNIVTQEQVVDAVKKLASIRDEMLDDSAKRGVPILEVEPEEQSKLNESFIQGSFTLIGKASKPVGLNPRTKLKLSPIGEAEVFGPSVSAPAHLRPFRNGEELLVPMEIGLVGYSTPVECKQIPNLDAIVSLATKPFRTASVGDFRGILDKKQAVQGIEGMKLKPVARGKSPGYPFVLDTHNGKREFFGEDGEFEFSSPQCVALFERVDQVVAKAKEGIRLSHIFTDFLKDETRPHHKVDAGETRVISGAPLDLVIATRMYFGAFMASMFRHHTVSGMCPGINPFNEWYQLASRLSSKGSKVFDGDFKAFDKTAQPYLHYAILRFINHWYDGSEEDERVRAVLWCELVHSRHLGGNGIVQDVVYQWNKCMPSGHPLTTPVNSLYSLITLTACYTKRTSDFTNMWDRVYIATFGDDNISNISDAVADVFNQVTVAEDMKELFGLVYTSGSKVGELSPYTILGKCTFLKRAFVRDPQGSGGWVAPLDPGSFLYTSYYYKNSRDPVSDMIHNLEGTLGELSLHDISMWNKHFPPAQAAFEQLGQVPAFFTRDAYRDMMRKRTDAWF